MNTNSKEHMVTRSQPDSAERRLKKLGIKLPAPPEPFGAYVEIRSDLLYGVASLPLGSAVELEVIFEVAG